jgi:hypothetical protein
MSRPLRLEFADAVYHVTSRGDRREPIYRDDADRTACLEVIAHTRALGSAGTGVRALGSGQGTGVRHWGQGQALGSGLAFCPLTVPTSAHVPPAAPGVR